MFFGTESLSLIRWLKDWDLGFFWFRRSAFCCNGSRGGKGGDCILVKSSVRENKGGQTHILILFRHSARGLYIQNVFQGSQRLFSSLCSAVIQNSTVFQRTQNKHKTKAVKWMTLLSARERNDLTLKNCGSNGATHVFLQIFSCVDTLLFSWTSTRNLERRDCYSLSFSLKWALCLYLQLSAKCCHNSFWE